MNFELSGSYGWLSQTVKDFFNRKSKSTFLKPPWKTISRVLLSFFWISRHNLAVESGRLRIRKKWGFRTYWMQIWTLFSIKVYGSSRRSAVKTPLSQCGNSLTLEWFLKVTNNDTNIIISTPKDNLITPYRLQKSEYAVDYWKSLGNSATLLSSYHTLAIIMIYRIFQ